MNKDKILFCYNCGTKLEEDTMFCGECGCAFYDSENDCKKLSVEVGTVIMGILLALLGVLEVMYILPLKF